MENTWKQRISHRCYRIIRWFVKLFYPRITVEGEHHLPHGPCLMVGNHAQMNGPIISELYIPGEHATWCAGEMMALKEVPAYAYQDFWSGKPRFVRWFYRLLSYLIAPLSVCVFNQARTIPVYRDSRILTTFRQTVNALSEGKSVVIFPEGPEPYSHIVNRFQDGFPDVARLYYRRTGKAVSFVPTYVAPGLKKVYLGAPIPFDPTAPKEQERERICRLVMDAITEMASALPPHTVVPYSNIPRKDYPTNLPCEAKHEKTCC